VIVIATIGATSSRAASIGRRHGLLALVQVPLDVFHHHDRVVDDEADRQHDGQQRQQVDRESGNQHQKHRADQRNRDRHDRDEHGSERTEEQEDHDDHDEQRFGQGPQHFADGVVDVLGRVVRDARPSSGRQLRLISGTPRDLGNHVERVRGSAAPTRP
jgi:hypothetical protein